MTTGPILVAGIWQETNSYSSRLTTLADYEEFELAAGDDVIADHRRQRSVIGGMLSVLGGRARAGLSAAAWPAGLTPRPVFDTLMDRFARALEPYKTNAAGVLLNLHGAMVAEDHPDVELDVVLLTRQMLGDLPIVAVLDFHANPSASFLAAVDAVTSYRTYPHVDMFERGAEAARIMLGIVEQGTRWSVQAAKLPLITSPMTQGTADQPVADLIEFAVRGSTEDALLCAMPGFAYSDVARGGFTAAVSSPIGSKLLEPATELARRAWERRDAFAVSAIPPEAAVRRALAAKRTTVLADVGDNIGGGSPGEGTVLLRALLEARAPSALVVINDARVAAAAHLAGVGAMLDTPIGATLDHMHGDPVPVRAEVRSTSGGRYVASGNWMGGHTFEMGPTAVLRIGGVHVIVTSAATPPFHREQITSQGLSPEAFGVVVAKGALAWQDALADIADGAIFVDTPGSTPAHPDSLPRSTTPDSGTEWVFPQRLAIG